MRQLRSRKDYMSAIDRIWALKADLLSLAATRSTVDPTVIAISQEIDGYIVLIQQYWKTHHDGNMTG